MFVVLGASGHTGQVVAENLLAAGQKVRVVGRNAERLQELGSAKVQRFLSPTRADAPALTKAFVGADGAYVMIPPDPTSNDYRAFQNSHERCHRCSHSERRESRMLSH